MNKSHIYAPFASAIVGVALLALMDALMKGASLAVGAYSAALLRAGIAALIVAPVWIAKDRRIPTANVLKLHLMRGTVSAFMALSFFYSLTKLPIAEAIAISFIAPLIALYLAAILLGEKISRNTILASILGLAGTIVIVGGRLGQSEADMDTLKGLCAILFSACLYAWNFIIIRQQALVSSPVEATTFHGGVSFLVLSIAFPWFFILPGSDALLEIGGAAILTVLGAIAISWAYARSEANLLIPMEYSGFLWASLFGWLLFDEQVTIPTALGAVLIILGCWLAARKRSALQTDETMP